MQGLPRFADPNLLVGPEPWQGGAGARIRDADGLLDVVVADERAGALAWLRGDGLGDLVPAGAVAVVGTTHPSS